MTRIELAALPASAGALRLPPMRMVEQRFDAPPRVDAEREIARQWRSLLTADLRPGASVAVAVGSRGIECLLPAVKAVVAHLQRAGCRPFIVPAMGSHGNATAAGQRAVLAERGITESSVGVPVRASMEVVSLGEVDGLPLLLDELAAKADGLVLINRVKPHTDFVGRFESGLMKMLVIGLSNEKGASAYHRHALTRGLADVIDTAGRALLKRVNFLFGVALVENQHHLTCQVHLVTAPEVERVEPELLDQARALLPRLPLDDIDVLIVDEMGKDVSGAGMDPNVTGRSTGCWAAARSSPRIMRILALDLTPATEGNACGLGSVDVAPLRLVEKIDLPATVANALASCSPEDGKLPLTFASDREALLAALTTLRPYTLEDLRIVHIRNTLRMDRLELSEGCLRALGDAPCLHVAPRGEQLAFDDQGALLSRLQ